MSRIAACMKQLKEQGKKALVPYFVTGDPSKDMTVPMMHAMVEAGANIIELGVPFSDPAAEGPVIQLAHERALENKVSLRDTLNLVKEFRLKDNITPVVLMGYCNPVEIMGYENFAKQASEAGVDGLLMVDLPPAEAGSFTQHLTDHSMNEIFLLSPTTLPERREQVLTHCGGYIYYVSLKGVTGSATLDTDDVATQVQAIKAETDLPVCVGFGIRDGASAKAIGTHADGVIVGSALVQNFADIDAKNILRIRF